MNPNSQRKAMAARYLAAARRIDEGKSNFIAYGEPMFSGGAALSSQQESDALEKMAGDHLHFDDDENGNRERVLFLCFAAAITERP